MKTVSQLARMGNVSAQTVRNEAKRQNILLQKEGKGFCFTDEDGYSILTALDVRREKSSQRVLQNDLQMDGEEPQSLLQSSEVIRTLSDQISALMRQMEEKDHQIEKLQAHIDDQSAHIKELMSSLTAAQALHAGTIQERLASVEDPIIDQETAEETPPAEEIPRRRSWWKTLFGL